MGIKEFEARVKQYAFPINKGFVNINQIMEAFKDTQIFKSLRDPDHAEYKFLLSPFVAHFPIGSELDIEDRVISLKTLGRSTVNFKEKAKSVVDDYLEQIQQQQDAKLDPTIGLDPELVWISVNALILIGILKCQGTDSEKASVFYRVVAPEMSHRVLVFDKDIRMSIFFLTNLTTILEFMQ